MKLTNLLLLVATMPMAQAVVLARWTPQSVANDAVIGGAYNLGTETPAPDETAAGLMVSNLDRVGAAEFAGGNAGIAWPGLGVDGVTAISLSDYTSFSITPLD